MNIIIMIPSLNPDHKLVDYVKQLAEQDFREILVVNDGSSALYDPIFDEIRQTDKCTVITHEVNQGKGRALKTGMSMTAVCPDIPPTFPRVPLSATSSLPGFLPSCSDKSSWTRRRDCAAFR